MFLIFFPEPSLSKPPPQIKHYNRSGHVQSCGECTRSDSSQWRLSETYKPLKPVSPPTGLNSNTRYHEMMEREQERIEEETSR